MTMLLVIGNKNLSSWSLRPWLLLRHAGLPFEERVLAFETESWRDTIAALSPTRRVPVLHHDQLVVWDSLAICEYLNDAFPDAQLWPRDRAVRAVARAVSAEMHSGFPNMRRDLSMDVVARHPRRRFSRETEDELARVQAIWTECRVRASASSLDGSARADAGPFLFGRFSIADAMYAPVIWRFRSFGIELTGEARAYSEAMLALPAMREWEQAAIAEVQALTAAARAAAPMRTPDPRSAQHCFAVIFSSKRTAEVAEDYDATSRAMVELAAKQPGFLGVESARGADGFGITVSYWDSLEAIRNWKAVPSHAAVQAKGKQSFYERYEVRVCTVERGYKFPS
ncbi:MAG: glutathione S-transferase [Myxococcaceae bacterium]|nr:glutathione S-transferase [Myxococcaceae bacterium]